MTRLERKAGKRKNRQTDGYPSTFLGVQHITWQLTKYWPRSKICTWTNIGRISLSVRVKSLIILLSSSSVMVLRPIFRSSSNFLSYSEKYRVHIIYIPRHVSLSDTYKTSSFFKTSTN